MKRYRNEQLVGLTLCRYRYRIYRYLGTYLFLPPMEDQKYQELGAINGVADPVHFRPDPDTANQNFKNRIRILLAFIKNQLKHQILFHIDHISSEIF